MFAEWEKWAAVEDDVDSQPKICSSIFYSKLKFKSCRIEKVFSCFLSVPKSKLAFSEQIRRRFLKWQTGIHRKNQQRRKLKRCDWDLRFFLRTFAIRFWFDDQNDDMILCEFQLSHRMFIKTISCTLWLPFDYSLVNCAFGVGARPQPRSGLSDLRLHAPPHHFNADYFVQVSDKLKRLMEVAILKLEKVQVPRFFAPALALP